MSPRSDRAALDVLRTVPLLASVPDTALAELATRAAIREVPPGTRLVAELEVGEEMLIVLDGAASATVGGLTGDVPAQVGTIGPGDCVGEMALFTGELRSATVTATSAMTLLAVDRPQFHRFLRRHPAVAGRLADMLAARLGECERMLTAVLDPGENEAGRRRALDAGGSAPLAIASGRLVTALRVAWREIVMRHRRELPFLTLVAFVVTLITTRAAVALVRALVPQALGLQGLLRASYVSGLVLLCVSGAASLLLFRTVARRRVAVLYGTGMALLLNALPVLLTFDLFYRDMVTRDPNLTFSIDTLYARSEGANLAIVTAALLFQAAYLWRFYRRALAIVALRLRRRRAVNPPSRGDASRPV